MNYKLLLGYFQLLKRNIYLFQMRNNHIAEIPSRHPSRRRELLPTSNNDVHERECEIWQSRLGCCMCEKSATPPLESQRPGLGFMSSPLVPSQSPGHWMVLLLLHSIHNCSSHFPLRHTFGALVSAGVFVHQVETSERQNWLMLLNCLPCI